MKNIKSIMIKITILKHIMWKKKWLKKNKIVNKLWIQMETNRKMKLKKIR